MGLWNFSGSSNKRSSPLLRYIDFYIGIPLIWILSISFKVRKLPEQINIIGLIQPTAIGDVILASSLIDRLNKKFPNAKILLFCGDSNAQVISLLGAPVLGVVCNFKNPLSAIKNIRKHKVDLLIDLVSWSRVTALIAYFSKSSYTIGFEGYKQFRARLFDKKITHLLDRHESENFKAIGDSLGLRENVSMCVKLVENPILLDKIKCEEAVIFHIGAGGSMAKFKSWPSEKWVKLGQNLCKLGWTLYFTGVKKDSDEISQIISRIEYPNQCVNLSGKFVIPELAFILSKVKLVVSIDTGVMHLASWVNAPVVGLHGPTSSSRWGLLNSKGISINSPHKSAGYINFGFERNKFEEKIMDDISVEMVLDKVSSLLKKAKT